MAGGGACPFDKSHKTACSFHFVPLASGQEVRFNSIQLVEELMHVLKD